MVQSEGSPPDPQRSAAVALEAVSEEFLRRIPRDFAREHLILSGGSIGENGPERLLVASTTLPAAIHNVGVRLGRATEPIESDPEAIARGVNEAYGRAAELGAGDGGGGDADAGDTPSELLPGEDDLEALLRDADRDLLATQGKGPVIRLVDSIVFDGLGSGASDVHIQPTASTTLVRFRLDGVLRTVREIPRAATTAIVSRIKVMGRMDIAERRVPQDGRATVRIGERSVDLRISTIPTSYGERAVLRLLDTTQQLADLDGLGMPPDIEAAFEACARRSHGLILVTGPTGSGKTTTLYATLCRVGSIERNVMTIEDPIEYELGGEGRAVSQSQVNDRKGVSFATGLRHILRQDPDVVMVGEIRDADTAAIAVQASMTGHLVLSTLHTNDAPGAVARLVDLGVEPYMVSASLAAVLAQRLVRRCCPACGGRAERPGESCPECLDSGFRGRVGLFELLVLNERLSRLVSAGADLETLRAAAREDGWRPLRDAGDELVAQGRTTRAELARIVEGRA